MNRSHNILLLVLFSVLAILHLVGVGCSRPRPSTDGPKDSTRIFQEIVESTSVLGLSKEEYAGKLLFKRYCEVCHGVEGDGKGFNAFNLQNSFGVLPADFTDTTAAARTEQTIITTISRGGTAVGKSRYMPPWGNTLRSEQIENLAAYVKSLARLKKENVALH